MIAVRQDREQASAGARLPRAVPVAIAGAWALAVIAQLAGRPALLDHDALNEGGLPVWAALGAFWIAWQAMLVAMMLPSSLPFVRLYAQASAEQPSRRAALAAFLGGYACVWTLFGTAAFLGDGLLHLLLDRSPWISQRPWLVAGSVLGVAGSFQFTALKDACLESCRHPAAYLLRYYRRGVGAGFRIGWGHGLFCLGCCWALMLVAFAVGTSSLWWMAVLAALMVHEKTGRSGRRTVSIAGVTLLAWSALVFAHPSWLPGSLLGA